MTRKQEVDIARNLLEAEGADVEFMSIHEAIGDLVDEGVIALTDDEMDKMAERINSLISSAVISYTFPEEPK